MDNNAHSPTLIAYTVAFRRFRNHHFSNLLLPTATTTTTVIILSSMINDTIIAII